MRRLLAAVLLVTGLLVGCAPFGESGEVVSKNTLQGHSWTTTEWVCLEKDATGYCLENKKVVIPHQLPTSHQLRLKSEDDRVQWRTVDLEVFLACNVGEHYPACVGGD